MLDFGNRNVLILFNGPPGSGKDTAADLVRDCAKRTVLRTKFANSMKVNVMAALGVGPKDGDTETKVRWFDLYFKEQTHPEFGGLTGREIVIRYSENFCKPNFGIDFFGRLTADEVTHRMYAGDDLDEPVPTVVTVSDSGFAVEGNALIQARTAGYGEQVFDRIVMVRMHRDGCNFDSDSRSYWSPRELDLSAFAFESVEECDVVNNGSLLELEQRLASIIPDIMEVRTYQLQVQLPTDPIGEPGWASFSDNVRTIDEALAICQTARNASYQNRVVRIVRKGARPEVVKVVFPGDAPCYSFTPANLPQPTEIVS